MPEGIVCLQSLPSQEQPVRNPPPAYHSPKRPRTSKANGRYGQGGCRTVTYPYKAEQDIELLDDPCRTSGRRTGHPCFDGEGICANVV